MTAFLRFLGIVNAGVWFGAAFFLTVFAAPAIFSPAVKALFGAAEFGQAYVGLIAQTVLGSYFILQYWCGGIALLHQLAEWVYLGRRLHRPTMVVLLIIFALSLLGGLWLQPKMNQWHRVKYATELYRQQIYSEGQTAEATRLFAIGHGVSQTVNLFTMAGLAFLLWRLSQPPEGPRYFSAAQFRS